MESNKAKCKIQHISKKESPSTNRYYTLDGRQLERVSTITDTGMTVSSDMCHGQGTYMSLLQKRIELLAYLKGCIVCSIPQIKGKTPLLRIGSMEP